jgi:hypothetical protein
MDGLEPGMRVEFYVDQKQPIIHIDDKCFFLFKENQILGVWHDPPGAMVMPDEEEDEAEPEIILPPQGPS